MSSKKIGYYEADNIARRVAEKAFEHLYAPLEATLKAEGQRVYDLVLKDAEMTPTHTEYLVDLGVIQKTSSCTLTVSTVAKDDGVTYDKDIVMLGDRGYDLPRTFLCYQLKLPNEVTEDLLIAYEKLAPIEMARSAFEVRVKQDIMGKTYSRVLKTWPEIAGFIDDEHQLPNGTMVVPFSDLIQKYLSPFMALPAPEAA